MNDRRTVFPLARVGKELLTRQQAAPVRATLRGLVESGEHVEVDFSGVLTLTPSFADEALGRLLLELGPERFRARVSLKTGDHVIRRLVNAVLAHRLDELTRSATPPER